MSFPTEGPASLYVEIGSGQVTVQAIQTDMTEVHVEGRDADEVIVEQRGEQIVVIAPQRRGGLFGWGGELTVDVTLPLDSDLATKLGSADLDAAGRYGAARIRCGSGDVRVEELTADAVVETGSGDVDIETSLGDLRIKAGSGDVTLRRSAGSLVVSTGSGSVELGTAEDRTAVKSGSGDIQVEDAHNDISTLTGSGDLHVGRIRKGTVKAKAASGDVHVGVPAGIPVWTDISCVSGHVVSNLEGAGQPEDGQDYIEIRATTVSGDITLSQL
ncbi:MAG TPA: DUF4097 family beta strand repeat-containing protein [Nocardioidaceae bacterium]|nr:DUF4097 family beta strand repeat-containing protein [Nocardioidaceae bacterium]